MLEMMFVSGVATQGCMINDSWVRSYKFVYRGDGKAWTKYTEADTEQVRISLYWNFLCFGACVTSEKSRNFTFSGLTFYM